MYCWNDKETLLEKTIPMNIFLIYQYKYMLSRSDLNSILMIYKVHFILTLNIVKQNLILYNGTIV